MNRKVFELLRALIIMNPFLQQFYKFSILVIKKLLFWNELRLEKFVFRLIGVFKGVWYIVIDYILILRLFLKMRFFYV